jgi:CRP-like cAMP-binding protein
MSSAAVGRTLVTKIMVGRIVEEYSENNNRIGLIEFDGKRRRIYLNLVPEAHTGDCVRFHAGFATETIGPCSSDAEAQRESPAPDIGSIGAYRLLSELDPEQLRKLLPLCQDQQYEPGQIIFHAGENSAFLHLIVSGEVVLEEDMGDTVLSVYNLCPGDAMGWSSLTREARTHFQARAVSHVSTLAFPGGEIRAACDRDPVLGYALMKRLLELVTERLDATRMKLAELRLTS